MPDAQLDAGKIRDSIRGLKEFYSGVLALALYEAIRGVAETHDVLRTLQFRFFLLAFCATLIPFYHGLMRYFDDSYLSDAPEPKPASFMFDYLLFCVLGGLLVWMGAIFGTGFDGDYFIRVYAALLAMDVVWGFMTHFLTNNFKKVKYWLWLNFGVLVVIALLWAISHPFQGYQITVFLIIAPVRSILDYAWNWDMYFPKISGERSVAAA
ncbi:MAG TPA: hypothetical protein VI685_18045 [Candidatus Angelobacter sp.]